MADGGRRYRLWSWFHGVNVDRSGEITVVELREYDRCALSRVVSRLTGSDRRCMHARPRLGWGQNGRWIMVIGRVRTFFFAPFSAVVFL